MTQRIYPSVINTDGSVSGQYLKNQDGSTVWADVEGGTWGSISGDIADQIDLGNALAAKLNLSDTTVFSRSLLTSADAQAARSTLGLVDSVEGLDPLALTTSLIPATDNTYSLGSATHKWKDIFVSANTIYLGEGTQLSGTSIVVDAPGATSLAQMPTIKASKIVAVPFTYNNGGPVNVRPSIEFQIGTDSYPISLNTETFEFSLDAQGNHGTGSLVAKKITLANSGNTAFDVSGAIAHAGNYLNTQTASTFRFDGDVTLGYDANRTITLKGNTVFQGGVQFQGATTVGDGNDSVTVNAGINPFTVVSDNFTLDAAGNVVIDGNLTISGTTTTINSNTLNIGDNIIVLNADMTANDVPTQDAGIQVARGEEAAVRWLWKEGIDAWSPEGGNIAGVGTMTATSFVGSLTGAATSAARLTNARTINGVAFDGTTNITITDPTAHAALVGKLDDSQAGAFGLALLASTTSAEGTSLLNTFTPTVKGLVPAPTIASGAFLKDDGTWAVPDQAFALTDGTKGEITVSSGGTVWTIDANVITMGKIQQVGTATLLGRSTAGSGNVEVMSLATAKTLLGISNVNNTSDAAKPISTAMQTALDSKVDEGLLTDANFTISTGSLAGRTTPSNGPVEEITIGEGLTLDGSELSVSFLDNGWGTSILATGTASPQNIELPESGLTPLDVMVFNDGIRFYSAEYTITGSTLQMTSNFAGDQIEIIKVPTRTILSQTKLVRSVISDNSATYTPNSTATTHYVRLTSNAAINYTVPSLFAIGTELVFEQAGTGTVTIVAGSGVTLRSRGSRFASAGQYAVVNIKKVSSSTWVISGDVV